MSKTFVSGHTVLQRLNSISDSYQFNDTVFDTTKRIGKGSFGTVYKGFNQRTKQTVAVKVIDVEADDEGDFSSSFAPYASFEREVEMLYKLSQPCFYHLVKPLEVMYLDTKACITMEYCDGGDLSHFLRGGKLDNETVKWFTHQLAAALHSLQMANVIHRDLKPSNVLICIEGDKPEPFNIKLKVADFGLSRILLEGSLADTRCGSMWYMAPEVIKMRRYDSKVDIWSAGLVLFECATGHLPFAAENDMSFSNFIHAKTDEDLSAKFPEEMDKDLVRLISSMLKVEPVDRISLQTFLKDDFFKRGYFCLWDVHTEVLRQFFSEPVFSTDSAVDRATKQSFALGYEKQFQEYWRKKCMKL